MPDTSILLVEDEAIIAHDISDYLRSRGFRVSGPADSYGDALNLARAERPDVALIDIRLKHSGRDGIDLAGALAQYDIPTVFLTSHSDDNTLERARQTRPYAYVLKPYNERELELALTTAVQRSKADREGRRLQQLMFAVLGSVSDALIALASDGSIVFSNDAACARFGLNSDAIAGRRIVDIIEFGPMEGGARRAPDPDFLARSAAGSEPQRGLLFCGTSPGVPVELSVKAVQNSEPLSFMLSIADISAEHQANLELKRRSAFLRTVVDGILDSLLVIEVDADQRLKCSYVNPAYTELTGQRADEIEGGMLEDFMPKQDLERLRPQVLNLVETGVPRKFETEVLTPSGPKPMITQLTRVEVRDGITTIVAARRDISAQRQAETTLQYRFRLEQLISAISKGFVSSELHMLDREIVNALENVSRFMGFSVAAVFQLDPESETLRNQHRWAAETAGAGALEFDDGICRELTANMDSNSPVLLHAGDLADSALLHAWMRTHDIQRVRLLPLKAEQGIFGMLLFGENSPDVSLDTHANAGIEIIAELIANAETRRRIHMNLRKSEDYLTLAQNVAGIGSWEYSPGSNITTTGEELDKLFGLTRKNKPQTFRAWRKVIHEEDRNRVVTGIINALRDGKHYSTMYRIVRSDGESRWHQLKARVVRDIFGENKLIAVNYDITDRKVSRDKLQASERRYRQLVEATPDGIIVHRRNRILYSNPSAARMLGADKPADLVGMAVMDFVHPDYREFVARRVAEVQNSSVAAPLAEEKLLRMDGTPIDVEIVGIAVRYDEESATQAIIRDITERKLTQLRLRESEEKLRLMVEHANDTIFTLRPDYEISYISPAIQNQLGFEPEFLIGRPLQRWVHGEDMTALEAALETLEARPEERIEVEYRIRNVMREWRWHSTTLSVITDGVEYIQGFVGVSKDITLRKEMEVALRSSEQEMRNVFEHAHDAILILDEQGESILDVNERACELYGYTRRTFKLMTPAGLVAASGGGDEYFSATVAGKSFNSCVTTHLRADGAEVVLEVHSSMISFRGRPAVLCSLRDITERMAAQEEIRKLSLVASNTSNGVVIAGREGRVEWVNEGFTRISGYRLDDVIGRHLGDLKAGAATDPAVLTDIAAAVRQGRPFDAEILNYNADGGTYWAQLQIAPMEGVEDTGGGNFVVVLTDITDLKHHEAELKAAKRELEASNQILEIRVAERTNDLHMAMRKLSEALEKEKLLNDLKSRFVSMVSHEFRTPLSSILGSAELLDRYLLRLDDKSRKDRFQQIYIAVDRMTEILDQVVSLSQSEALSQSFEPRSVPMQRFVQSTVQQFRSEHAPERRIDFVLSGGATDTDEAQVDVKLLEPALIGVLKNAVQYSPPETRVLVSLYLERDDVIIRVSDSGVGIPQDEVNLIFEPFHRAANVEIVPGTGLGLVFVKQCVERHGGEITVESSLGQGTTIILKLPRHLAELRHSP